MCRDEMQSILVKGCCAWSCQVKEEEKTKDKVHGCGKGGYASGWSVR